MIFLNLLLFININNFFICLFLLFFFCIYIYFKIQRPLLVLDPKFPPNTLDLTHIRVNIVISKLFPVNLLFHISFSPTFSSPNSPPPCSAAKFHHRRRIHRRAKKMSKLPTLLLLLLCLASFTSGEIKKLKIRSDNRPMILFERFGFTHTGQASISVSSVSVISSLATPDPSGLGFFLLSEESLIQVLIELQQNPNFCVLESNYIQRLFTFRDLSPPPNSSFDRAYPVTSPNEYSLFFANCAPESKVSMDVRTELYNLDGRVKDYLSAGFIRLPTLFFSDKLLILNIFLLVIL